MFRRVRTKGITPRPGILLLCFMLYVTYQLMIKRLTPKRKPIAEVLECLRSKNIDVLDVQCFGALGDDYHLNTVYIQAALDYAYETGGGVVSFPPRTCDKVPCSESDVYRSGSVFIRSNTVLRVGAGVILQGSTDKVDYPHIYTRSEGKMTKKHASLINIGRCLELSSAPSNVGGKSKKLDDMCLDWEKNRNVTIEGDGTIDGAGMAWWEEKGALRPTLVGPIFVDGLVLHGIKLINSAFWTVHPLFCNDVSITDVDINAPSDSPNTDGIDPDSCTNVYIARCKISVGDDCIAIKSGRDAAARRIGKPTQNVLVEDMAFGQCHGLTIGSEMSGGVQNVTIRNSVSTNSKRGYPLIRIKTRQGRGSYVRDVTFSNITADFATYLMRVDMFYPPQPARGKYPIISDITVKDITLQRAFGVWLFECLDTAPCRNFHLEGNSVTTFDKGFYGKNVYGTATNNEPAIELNPMQGSMQMQLDEELEKAARKE